MPNHCSKKKSTIVNNQTIDEKHAQLMEEFSVLETEIIPHKELQLEALKTEYKNLNKSTQIDKRMDMRDQIRDLKAELKDLRERKQHYLLENAPIIFNYFEEKKRISDMPEIQQTASMKERINAFFKIKTTTTTEEDVLNNPKYADSQAKAMSLKYWCNVNKDFCGMDEFSFEPDICQRCNIGELIPQDEDGILICNNKQCGVYYQNIVDNEKPTYKEPPNEVTYNAYNRVVHFKEILSQFQAKETTQIPQEVMEKIKARIKKERITDLASEINYEKMREILKTLGCNRYFEHIQYINSILGIKPPVMCEKLQETLCVLFIEVQEAWAIHCPAHRTNFFNCTYTLYQLCVLVDQTQFLPFIPMMKDREKQLEQDMVWKKVCETKDWVFVPTV